MIIAVVAEVFPAHPATFEEVGEPDPASVDQRPE